MSETNFDLLTPPTRRPTVSLSQSPDTAALTSFFGQSSTVGQMKYPSLSFGTPFTACDCSLFRGSCHNEIGVTLGTLATLPDYA